jgi:hypothetical protein
LNLLATPLVPRVYWAAHSKRAFSPWRLRDVIRADLHHLDHSPGAVRAILLARGPDRCRRTQPNSRSLVNLRLVRGMRRAFGRGMTLAYDRLPRILLHERGVPHDRCHRLRIRGSSTTQTSSPPPPDVRRRIDSVREGMAQLGARTKSVSYAGLVACTAGSSERGVEEETSEGLRLQLFDPIDRRPLRVA